jgi:hypothetical protein
MLSPEERALLTEKQDQLIELFVERDEAKIAEDWDRLRVLEDEISSIQGQREAIRQLA